ncbi:MAG: hypothetical protein KAT78_00640 [Flavobacteriaceae bacterium]|nr:hypothetical protein [Flavobacteriaceae bacterium]
MGEEKKRTILYNTKVEPNIENIPQWRAVEGLTEKQIAIKMGIGYTVFREYKNNSNPTAIKHDIDTTALAIALNAAEKELEHVLGRTLYQEALGLRPDVKIWDIEEEYDIYTDKWIPIKRKVKHDNKRNMTALIFALKNLNPEKWRDRKDVTNIITEDDRVTIINDLIGDYDEGH